MAEAREEHADAIRAMAEYIATTEDVMIWTPTALLRATFLHIQEFEQRESAFVAALRESHNIGWKWVIDDALGEIERTENNREEMQVFDAISAIVAAHDARETPVVGADNP